MPEKNLWSKLGLIVLLVGLSIWESWPPKDNIKLGIDLGGGHSLLFEVDDSGLDEDQKKDLAERVTAILRQRVDPQNNRNLIWRPIGWNRIEIQMPGLTKEQGRFREAFEEARDALQATHINESEIRSALGLPPEERQKAFERMVGPVTSRRELFEKLAAAEDEYRQLKASTTQPAEGELARKIDDAFARRRELIEQIRNTNVNAQILVDILELDRDKKGDIRSQRLEEVRKDHPDLVSLIDPVVAAYDRWAERKGALDDPSDLMRLIRGAGILEFRILAETDANNPGRTLSPQGKPQYSEDIQKYIDQLTKYGPRLRPGDNYQWFEIANPEENSITTMRGVIVSNYLDTPYVLAHATGDMGLLNTGDNSWTLRGAYPIPDEQGRPAVHFELDPRGGARFADLTGNNINRPLCILLDDQAISAPNIRSEIREQGQITGNFSQEEVNYLVNTLDAGVLPARLKETPLQQHSVGPGLGDANRTAGIRAVAIAFILIIAFMAVYYAYNGVIADIALLMNLVITVGVMCFLQATFTLPGIAGLVLTLGMAVDANVLIFERIREELARGVSVRMAVKLGYERAFSAILDSNVTTIITAVILASLGSEEIKGFGLTLGIGLAVSLFTALFVTRQFFNVMVPTTLNSQEVRKAWLGAGILALAGGLFMGLGWVIHRDPEGFQKSTLAGFGQFFLVLFATAAVLLLSLWAFRIMYRVTGHQRQGRMPMMKLFSAPNINWMGMYKGFWAASAVVIGAGFVFEAYVDKSEYLDIEFLGGTKVQVVIKPKWADEFQKGGDEKLLAYIRGEKADHAASRTTSVGWLQWAADQIGQATVTAQDSNLYLVTTPEKLTFSQMEALLTPALGDYVGRAGFRSAENGILAQLNPEAMTGKLDNNAESIQNAIRDSKSHLALSAGHLRNSRVQSVESTGPDGKPEASFEIITTETQRSLVAEALLAAMGPGSEADLLKVSQPIEARLVTDPERALDGLFPIKQGDNLLSEVIGGEAGDSVVAFKGGVALVFDNLEPPATLKDVEDRLSKMRLQPGFEETGWRDSKIFGLTPATGSQMGDERTLYTKIAIAAVDPSIPYMEGEDNTDWRERMADKELTLAKAALAKSTSLESVTQFERQVAGETVQKAVIAIILSMIAIAVYVWIRFGSVEFGLCGIIALYHDVAVTLSAIMAAHHLWDTPIGAALGLTDFRIDLSMIAALLTIVGFSINDTIVIFDRIRENRGRLAVVSPKLINDSLNQTLSRTLITSFTLLIVVVAMYLVGGEGIHGFAFAMTVGCLSGVYSTVAIATPMLHHPRAMWVVTITLATLTLLLLISMVGVQWLKYALMAITLIAGVALLIRQWQRSPSARSFATGTAG